VVRADPILTREVFDRIGNELADRENRKEPTKRSTGLLLQIIHCGVCGRPAYRLKGGTGRTPRYRCSSAQYKATCGGKSIPLDYADDVVESIILLLLGESERLERVWDSGSDHSAELAEIDATLEDLVSLLGSGEFRAGTPQRVRLNQRLTELAARQAELSAEAVKPAGWTWEPTGERFSDWWGRQDVTRRNTWLREMNVRLDFTGKNVHLTLGDVFLLTEQMNANGPVTEYQQVLSAMRDNGIAGLEIDGDDYRIIPA
jgi:site-specific DNA recombinase